MILQEALNIIKKIYFIFALMIILLTSGCKNNGEVVTFSNDYLEETIRIHLDNLSGDIYEKDLLEIEDINVTIGKRANGEEQKVSNLEGIEYLKNLKRLRLENQSIEDLNPLIGLEKLETLEMGNNRISDLAPLSELTNLIALRLEGNDIIDITPLSHLTNLEDLTLYDNDICDISPVSSLPNLKTLWIHTNNIKNIHSLTNLPRIERLHVANNPAKYIELQELSTTILEVYIDESQIENIAQIDDATYQVSIVEIEKF